MKFKSTSMSETMQIGYRLGKKLKKGDVVCLFGDLGVGKTTLTKGIASALGISERDITSASFTIIAEYEGAVPFYHIDLYRIRTGETSELGLYEYLRSDGISVIEWAEKAAHELPESSIKVDLKYGDDHDRREITVKGIEI